MSNLVLSKTNLIILLSLWLLSLGLIIILSNNFAKEKQKLAEKISLESSSIMDNSTSQKLLEIEKIFPDRQSIVEFIDLMDQKFGKSFRNFSFKFLNEEPSQEKFKFLPIEITLKTDFNKFSQVLADIFSWPYLLEFESYSLEGPNILQDANVHIFAKLYVKDSF